MKKHLAFPGSPKETKLADILASTPRWSVTLSGFHLTKSWDDDDEECLDVDIVANGQILYTQRNENHEVCYPHYGAGATVVVIADAVDVSGFVKCTDYHKPYYGSDAKSHKQAVTDSIGASEGGGGWRASYRITRL